MALGIHLEIIPAMNIIVKVRIVIIVKSDGKRLVAFPIAHFI